jgi:hypothetical protein
MPSSGGFTLTESTPSSSCGRSRTEAASCVARRMAPSEQSPLAATTDKSEVLEVQAIEADLLSPDAFDRHKQLMTPEMIERFTAPRFIETQGAHRCADGRTAPAAPQLPSLSTQVCLCVAPVSASAKPNVWCGCTDSGGRYAARDQCVCKRRRSLNKWTGCTKEPHRAQPRSTNCNRTWSTPPTRSTMPLIRSSRAILNRAGNVGRRAGADVLLLR